MDFTRQEGIIKSSAFKNVEATLIGAGAVGSFTALTLCKMGLKFLQVFDDDGVSQHNLPNQFYRIEDAVKFQFKVVALNDIINAFTDSTLSIIKGKYANQILEQHVLVATDSMSSRKLVWEQFKKQPQARFLIEARMGGQSGMVYTICKDKNWEDNIKFYEATLFDDSEVDPVPCTERAIIYNVTIIAGFISRAFKSILNREKFPREVCLDMANLEIYKRD